MAMLMANISDKEHDTDNMTQTITKLRWKHEGSPTSSQNFLNFGPLTAKNRTGVFTHRQKMLHFSSLADFAHAHNY